MRISITAWIVVVAFSAFAAAYEGRAEDRRVDFNRDIRPLLSDRCLFCHGPDAEHRQAGLRLDDKDDVLLDRGGYRVIAPGDPEASELIQRVTTEDADLLMPPPDSGKSLSPDERELLRRWIEDGAEWSAPWAWVPPVRAEAPEVTDASGDRLHWIDAFIRDRLQQEGLPPSPPADAVTLIRRMSFDLTGLPPTIEDVERLQADWSPEVRAEFVDELLASEACAERLAMYWLDLVRYADTVGYHGDQDHNISPYRDWVIDAFWRNIPFDDFTRAQLAGDLLPDSNVDQKVASGYNRLLQTSHEGGVQPKEYLAIYGADRVRNVSAVWMGLTLGCAQCHDHKYDPLTSRDFYSVQAFFADLDEDRHFKVGTNSLPTARPPEIKVHSRREREELARLRARLSELEAEADASNAEERKQLGFAIEDLEANQRLTMISVATEPRPIRILPRGNWLDDSGPLVEPAVPESLGRLETGDRRATRLDLANWLVDAENGAGLLTARVMVNRFWYLMFGQGLARSLDDFGGQGSPPDHPELLDRLAVEFVESGWDVKHMLRLIALSRTYQQTSDAADELRTRDPKNILLARQTAFRLPAEMVRDNALAISGLLVREVGGGSIRPWQPPGYYRHLNFPTRTYTHHDDERQWKRGVYVHWQRQFLHPMLKAFDAPSREECTAERPISNTPLAALVLLNDPTFTQAAEALGQRMQQAPAESDRDRVRYGFRIALSRSPDAVESELLLQLLHSVRGRGPTEGADSGTDAAAAADRTADDRAWSEVARAILNLDEVITRY